MTSIRMRTITVAIAAGLTVALTWLPLPGIWWHVVRWAFYLPIFLTGTCLGPMWGLVGGIAASLLCAIAAASSNAVNPWMTIFAPDLAVVGLVGGVSKFWPLFRRQYSARGIDSWPALGQNSEPQTNFDLNSLASIENAARLLADGDNSEGQLQELVGIILTECERLSGSIKAVVQRNIAPPQEHQADITAIVDAAREAKFVLGGHGVTVRKNIAPGMPPIQCNTDQIRSLLMSLAIYVAESGLAGNEVVLNARDRDSGVILEVSNQGQRSVIRWAANKIFAMRPTTTGVNLAGIYDIVRQHGGTIRSNRSALKGLEFSVWLPLRRNAIYGSWQSAGRRG